MSEHNRDPWANHREPAGTDEQQAQQAMAGQAMQPGPLTYYPDNSMLHLRTQCLGMAMSLEDAPHDTDSILERAQRFWRFVQTGDTGTTDPEVAKVE